MAFFFLFMCMGVWAACMSVYHVRMCLLWGAGGRTEHQIPWNRSYRWLWTAMWESNPGTLEEQPAALYLWATPLTVLFWNSCFLYLSLAISKSFTISAGGLSVMFHGLRDVSSTSSHRTPPQGPSSGPLIRAPPQDPSSGRLLRTPPQDPSFLQAQGGHSFCRSHHCSPGLLQSPVSDTLHSVVRIPNLFFFFSFICSLPLVS